MIYQPREDSFLIKKHILSNLTVDSKVLDMGSGSGILAKEALKKTKDVTAVDIDKEAVSHLKSHYFNTIKSDLFKNIKGKYDLIIFNPPYLPEDKNEPQESAIQTTGGKKGYELTERFLKQAKSHLTKDGKILLLFSSLTKKSRIDKTLKQLKYKHKLLEVKSLFLEKLYVYLIWKI